MSEPKGAAPPGLRSDGGASRRGAAPPGLRSEERATREGCASRAPRRRTGDRARATREGGASEGGWGGGWGAGGEGTGEKVSDGLDELYQVSQAVLSVTRQMSVRDVLQVIVRSARSLVGARYAALGVPDEGDSFAEFVVDGISAADWQALGAPPRQAGMAAELPDQRK